MLKANAQMEENMATFIVGVVLVAVVSLIIRSMISDKRKGKSLQCGGDCSHCGRNGCS